MESRAKVEPGSGKHCVDTHFPKDPHCDICLKTKITKRELLAEDVLVQSCPARKMLVIWWLRITKFSVKEVVHATIIDTPLWYKIFVNSVVTTLHVKQKLLRRPRRAKWSSWRRRRNRKSFTTDNSLEFGKSCEEWSRNHCTSTPHRSETTGIAQRAVRTVKEVTSAVLLQSGLGN